MTSANTVSYHSSPHHRRSIRLKGFDYSRGAVYFVTMCVQDRRWLFGEVVRDAMVLNHAGKIVTGSWAWLADRYPYVEQDVWRVMPDHFHGILMVHADPNRNRKIALLPGTRRKPLGRLIGVFKTVSTKRINRLQGTPAQRVWQRGYFEHVVRDPGSLEQLRAYVAGNPARWALRVAVEERFVAR